MNTMKFEKFLSENFSSSAVSFVTKIPRSDVYISSKDGIDWSPDSDFTVYWTIEPNYSRAGVNWINISVQNVVGSATGVDEDDNEAGTMDNFFDGFKIVTEFEFQKDGSLHCGAIDIMLDEKTVQIS